MSIDRKDDALKHQAELRFLGELLAKASDYLTAEVRSYVQYGNPGMITQGLKGGNQLHTFFVKPLIQELQAINCYYC